MKFEEIERIYDLIDLEGFEYLFDDYSDFPEIEDSKLHDLREKYLSAKAAFNLYLQFEANRLNYTGY